MSRNYLVLAVFAAAVFAFLPAAAVQADVIGFWQFDEKSSGSADSAAGAILDSSGKGNHGTAMGSPNLPTYEAGYDGSVGCIKLTNSTTDDDRIDLGDRSAFELRLADLTAYRIEADIQTATLTNAYSQIFVKYDNAHTYGTYGYVLRLSNTGRLQFYLQGSYSATEKINNMIMATGTTDISDTTWHHVAAEITPSADPTLTAIKLYVDGNLQATAYCVPAAGFANFANENYVSDAPAVIGASDPVFWSDASQFAGNIDNVKFSAFPVPEPSTLALLGMGLTGLLAYAWRKRK